MKRPHQTLAFLAVSVFAACSHAPAGAPPSAAQSPAGTDKTAVRSPAGTDKTAAQSPAGIDNAAAQNPAGTDKTAAQRPTSASTADAQKSTSTAPTSVQAPAGALEPLAKDTPTSTAAGVSFTAPTGWTLAVSTSMHTLAIGDDLHVVLIDPKPGSAEAAVAAAWEAYKPGFSRPIRFAQPIPARDGWDEGKTLIYETSPNERLTVVAFALRKGDGWTVLLIDASDPAYERRASQVGIIRQSLRPPGYQRETFAGRTAHPLDAARIRQLTDFLETARQQAGIPGIAIALVQGDKVVYEGGLGVKALGQSAPVDADTKFMIASNTKPLSTLLLAKLIDEGRFAWDTPVTKVMPFFKLGDADTTRQVLMKHLVCACTGLPRQDFEWLLEFRDATPKRELDLLGTMQPTTKFGEVFQYSNLLASAAGFAGGYALLPKLELGEAYDEAMRTRVFEPLGMRDTTFDYAAALKGNHAMPHAEDVDGKIAAATMDVNFAIVPLRPAGGAWSTVRDLSRYVRMELANGKLSDGKPYISAENLLARRAPQVAVGADTTYGMGLFVDRKYGVPIVHHGGSMIGFKSDMFWLPENGVGGVILTNADAGYMLLGPFVRRLLEVLFDGNPEAAEDVASAIQRRKEMIGKERKRLVFPADKAVVAGLAATYSNPVLGSLEVERKDDRTAFNFGEWRSAVASRKNDDGSISLLTVDPGVSGFEFVIDARDGKKVLVVRDMQHEYVFTPTK